MRRSDAHWPRTVAERRRWFRSGKSRGKAVWSARKAPPWGARTPLTLRPVNVRGHIAKGMRAPENTNQFLMTEKYRLNSLRSDSVDSASDSDTEHELTDMDTYLCAWEDAHGALLDQDTEGILGERDRQRCTERTLWDKGERGGRGDKWDRDRQSSVHSLRTVGDRGTVDSCNRKDRDRLPPSQTTVRSLLSLQDEDSVQYFPSEDDLNLSDNFMHRDFTEFCHMVTS